MGFHLEALQHHRNGSRFLSTARWEAHLRCDLTNFNPLGDGHGDALNDEISTRYLLLGHVLDSNRLAVVFCPQESSREQRQEGAVNRVLRPAVRGAEKWRRTSEPFLPAPPTKRLTSLHTGYLSTSEV